MRLLLDTNVVVWLLTGNRSAVSPVAIEALTDDRNEIFVGAASVWEIAIKRSIGKLRFPDTWASSLHRLDFVALPITATHAQHVEQLPWVHRDPFDRILIAQAREERQTIVTADTQITKYEVATLW